MVTAVYSETLYYNKESGKVYSSEYVLHISFPNIIRRFKRISSVVLSEKRITVDSTPVKEDNNKDVINKSLIMLNDEIDALALLVNNLVEVSKCLLRRTVLWDARNQYNPSLWTLQDTENYVSNEVVGGATV